MKISSIPQLYRNVNRVREVVGVLIKYGLADWLSHVDIAFLRDLLKDQGGERLARQGRETRIRLALAELGPTFIKLGQILSTRPDLVGVSLADELRQLQSNTPADPTEAIRAIIEGELDCPLAEVFSDFDDVPLASASIGQVHRARLRCGTMVAVKVQHEGVREKIRVDVEILAGFAELVDQLPEFKNYRPKAVVDEFRRTIHHELDFSRELRHAQQFARNLAELPGVHIPRVFPDCSTSRVLTMEYLAGIKLADSDRLRAAGYDLQDLARRGADLYLHMIFIDGLYHADPHPGNVLVLDGAVIGLLDFGMVGQIDEQLREEFEEARFCNYHARRGRSGLGDHAPGSGAAESRSLCLERRGERFCRPLHVATPR
ncbi:MAG: AarF/UbiB family protein [Pirellulales bacterium]